MKSRAQRYRYVRHVVSGTRPSPWSPLSLGSLLVEWQEADGSAWQDVARATPAVADGDRVASILDKKTGAYATNAEGIYRPTLKLNILNGRPVWRFDGSKTYFLTTISQSQPMTIVLVHASRNTGQTAFVSGAGAAGAAGGFYIDPTTIHQFAGTALNATRAADTAFRMQVLKFNGASSTLRENGVNLVTGDAGAENLTAGSILGGTFLSTGIPTLPLNGDIAARFVLSGIISAANLALLESWLVAKYGTILIT